MTIRDDAILKHIAIYRLSFRAIIEKQFFAGKNCGNVIQRLLDAGRIQSRVGLPGRLSYYQLAAAEAIARGVPVARTRPLRSQALAQAIAVLWWCTAKERRHRLEAASVAALEAGIPTAPQIVHCVEQGTEPRVYRVEVVGPKTAAAGLVQRLQQHIDIARQHPTLAVWLRNHQYAIVILADPARRRELLQRAIDRSELRSRAHIVVDYAPTPVSIWRALHEHR